MNRGKKVIGPIRLSKTLLHIKGVNALPSFRYHRERIWGTGLSAAALLPQTRWCDSWWHLSPAQPPILHCRNGEHMNDIQQNILCFLVTALCCLVIPTISCLASIKVSLYSWLSCSVMWFWPHLMMYTVYILDYLVKVSSAPFAARTTTALEEKVVN